MDFTREEAGHVATLALAIERTINEFAVAHADGDGIIRIHSHAFSHALYMAVKNLNDKFATPAQPHVITRYVAENLVGRRLNDDFGKPGN